jgi:hypothetical protein
VFLLLPPYLGNDTFQYVRGLELGNRCSPQIMEVQVYLSSVERRAETVDGPRAAPDTSRFLINSNTEM